MRYLQGDSPSVEDLGDERWGSHMHPTYWSLHLKTKVAIPRGIYKQDSHFIIWLKRTLSLNKGLVWMVGIMLGWYYVVWFVCVDNINRKHPYLNQIYFNYTPFTTMLRLGFKKNINQNYENY